MTASNGEPQLLVAIFLLASLTLAITAFPMHTTFFLPLKNHGMMCNCSHWVLLIAISSLVCFYSWLFILLQGQQCLCACLEKHI